MDDWFRKIISIQRQQNTGIAPGRPRTPGPNAVPRSGRDESEPSNPFKLVEANLKSASRSREEHVIKKESLKSEELERGPSWKTQFSWRARVQTPPRASRLGVVAFAARSAGGRRSSGACLTPVLKWDRSSTAAPNSACNNVASCSIRMAF